MTKKGFILKRLQRQPDAEQLYMHFKGSTFQAVANSTNVHHNDATGHACAVGAHQWSEIYGYKTSGSKHIDGSKAWGSPVSHVRLLPTLLARGGVVLDRVVK